MPLGTAHMNQTTGAVFIPEVWAKEIQVATEANLVMANLVQRFDADVASNGDVIHIPNLSNLTANNKVTEVQVTLQAPTETETTITISNHKEVSFLVEDRVSRQSAYNLPQVYGKRAGYAIAQQIDADLASLYTGLSQSAGAGTTAMDLARIITAVQTLDLNDVPTTERYMLASPYAKGDLLAIDTLQEVDKSGTPNALRNGLIGDLFGVEIYVSSQTPQVTTVAHNILFHKDAFGLAIQIQPSVEMQRKTEFLGDLYVVQTLYGFAEIRDDHAVDVLSLAS